MDYDSNMELSISSKFNCPNFLNDQIGSVKLHVRAQIVPLSFTKLTRIKQGFIRKNISKWNGKINPVFDPMVEKKEGGLVKM